MKALHSEDNADKNITGSTRQHIISRLHKAVQSAKEIVTLLSDSASGATETDVLEARAYVYALAGAQDFEKQAEGIKAKGASPQRWDSCLTNFAAARVLYSALYKATKKDLFKDVLNGTIDPSIRYAAYQNRIPRTVGVPAVAKEYFPNKDEQLVKAVQQIDATALQEEEATASSKFREVPSVLGINTSQALRSPGEDELRTSLTLPSVRHLSPSKPRLATLTSPAHPLRQKTVPTRTMISSLPARMLLTRHDELSKSLKRRASTREMRACRICASPILP